jgi:hypothetical protein
MSKNKKKKNSSIAEIIGFLVLVYIIAKYLTVIKIIIAVLFVVVIFYFYSKRKESINNNAIQKVPIPAQNRSPEKEQLKRTVEILTDSINLINASNNLDVVLRRYDMAIDSLQKLSAYTDNELRALGLNLKEPLHNTLLKIQDNKIEIFNQAIIRNLEHEVISVTQNNAKVKHISKLQSKYESNPLLPVESRKFLADQCNIYISKYVPKKYTLIDSIEHTVHDLTMFDNETFTYNSHNDDFITKFYELSHLIDSSKDIYDKLDACEKSFPLLKEFCRFCLENDGELPPFINCRDVGPEMYMRIGKWDDAERVIQICIDAKAYYPNDGSQELTNFENYKQVALETLSFISQNPGCLQRNIYKVMGYEGDKKEYLKVFLRNSKLIQKVKYNNTNQLFCKSDDKAETKK